MNYADRLRDLRENKNLTQTEIAEILGISISLYSRYEKQGQIIPIKHLNSLANYFNVSLDYLLGFESNNNYSSNKDINLKKAGTRLKEFRCKHKLTQEKLANILNTTHSTISAYEAGITLITTPFLYTICKKYHESADYLLGKTD